MIAHRPIGSVPKYLLPTDWVISTITEYKSLMLRIKDPDSGVRAKKRGEIIQTHLIFSIQSLVTLNGEIMFGTRSRFNAIKRARNLVHAGKPKQTKKKKKEEGKTDPLNPDYLRYIPREHLATERMILTLVQSSAFQDQVNHELWSSMPPHMTMGGLHYDQPQLALPELRDIAPGAVVDILTGRLFRPVLREEDRSASEAGGEQGAPPAGSPERPQEPTEDLDDDFAEFDYNDLIGNQPQDHWSRDMDYDFEVGSVVYDSVGKETFEMLDTLDQFNNLAQAILESSPGAFIHIYDMAEIQRYLNTEAPYSDNREAFFEAVVSPQGDNAVLMTLTDLFGYKHRKDNDPVAMTDDNDTEDLEDDDLD